ncbi:hypothetical protein J6590_099198 [Homalodisca vitripennis]|nr:hypothetical protein J6590_099198 [Homalodisca vitripennis]
MERFGIGVVMESWGENNIKNEEQKERRKSRTGFERRRSGVPVLVFVRCRKCGGLWLIQKIPKALIKDHRYLTER